MSSVPEAIADAIDCAARASGKQVPVDASLEYGRWFGTSFRFRTQSGEAPVMQLLWRREGADWKIAAYTIELP